MWYHKEPLSHTRRSIAEQPLMYPGRRLIATTTLRIIGYLAVHIYYRSFINIKKVTKIV